MTRQGILFAWISDRIFVLISFHTLIFLPPPFCFIVLISISRFWFSIRPYILFAFHLRISGHFIPLISIELLGNFLHYVLKWYLKLFMMTLLRSSMQYLYLIDFDDSLIIVTYLKWRRISIAFHFLSSLYRSHSRFIDIFISNNIFLEVYYFLFESLLQPHWFPRLFMWYFHW